MRERRGLIDLGKAIPSPFFLSGFILKEAPLMGVKLVYPTKGSKIPP